ncbi:hypothetical protein Scep_005701 [Stephania cephalantha]|uniref:J domain-containing protein n=1 Tax=Stephania cephalantha TaxID=152367 RepID=A0AAP0PWM4_9MAGN
MILRGLFSILLFVSLIFIASEAKSVDPYKVIGVDRSANQREIQKAFHKLSLKYHPDKNKSKGAQEKFAEINNAYEILSNEEKRKNYDLYGDEKGAPRFENGGHGDDGGYTYFTSGGPGSSGFTFGGPGSGNFNFKSGAHGNSKSFSYSFGNPSSKSESESSFGHGMSDMFMNLIFGGGKKGGSQFESDGFGGASGRQFGSGRSTPSHIQAVNSQLYAKEIADQGFTWLLLSYTPAIKGYHVLESMVEEVATSLEGAMKTGSINCQKQSSFCKELGVNPSRSARIFVYSYRGSDKGSLVEYKGDRETKALKVFCQDHLPRFSRRIDVGNLDFSLSKEDLPRVLLFSTKKDTPVIWRALSGLYRKRILFYDAEVHSNSQYRLKLKLGLSAYLITLGKTPRGEYYVYYQELYRKNVKSNKLEFSRLFEGFIKLTKNGAYYNHEVEVEVEVELLTRLMWKTICGLVGFKAIIGVGTSSSVKRGIEYLVSSLSLKSLSKHSNLLSSPSLYAFHDFRSTSSFLSLFFCLGKWRASGSAVLMLAYQKRRGEFATYVGSLTYIEDEKISASFCSGREAFTKPYQAIRP